MAQEPQGGVEFRVEAESAIETIRRFVKFFGVANVQKVIDQEFADELQTVSEEPLREPIPNREVLGQAVSEIGDPLLPKILVELAKSESPVRRSDLAKQLNAPRQKVSSAKKKVNNWFIRHHMKELIKSKRVRLPKKGWARNYELSHPRFREWITALYGNEA